MFAGLKRPEEFRLVTPAHLIAWRDGLGERVLGGNNDTAPHGCPVVAVPVSVRQERRYPQSGERCEAPPSEGVPGMATGAHIHIGTSSTKLVSAD